MNKKLDDWIDRLSNQRHVIILRESLQPILVFWACIGITLLVAKYATAFPMKKLSAIAVMVMMASLVYVISSRIAKHYGVSGGASGLASVFVCFLCSYQEITDNPLQDYAIWILLAIGLGECFGYLSRFEIDNRFTPLKARKYLADLFPCIGTMLLGLFIAFLSPLVFPVIRKVFLLIAHFMDNLAFVIFTVVLISVSKLFRPELSKIYRAVIRPFWIYMSLANFYAFFHKSAYPFITTESFYHWFVWVGGAGTCIGLALDLLLVRRKKCNQEYIRECVFNLNDTLMSEEVMKDQKKYIVPFALTPVILAATMYMAIAHGFIKPPRLMAPWMLPGPIGAYLASGLDNRAVFASLICVLISMFVYLPFVLYYEKKK